MPRLALQLDSETGCVWIVQDGQRRVPLHEGDDEGLKIVTTMLVDSGVIDAAEAAAVQDATFCPLSGMVPWRTGGRLLDRLAERVYTLSKKVQRLLLKAGLGGCDCTTYGKIGHHY